MTMNKRLKEAVENTAFYDFLGKENVEDLKKGITDALLNHFIEDLERYPYYLIDEDSCREIVYEVLDAVKEEILNEYKEPLKQLLVDKLFASLDKDSFKQIVLGD